MALSMPSGLRRIHASAGAAKILEMFREDGGVIIEGFFTPEQVANINRDVDPYLAKVKVGTNREGDWIKDFHGENTRRLTNLPTLSRTFREEVLNYELIHELCEAVFRVQSGDYWMCTAQVIEIGPKSKPQELHRDTAEFPGFTKLGPAMDEIQISFFTSLTEFTAENGATRAIPGSHLWPDYEELGTEEMAVPAVMQPGDVLFFTGRLVHGGGENRTSDVWRRGISLAFQASYLTPEECYPLIIPRPIVESMTPLAQKMVAWRSQYSNSSGGLWQSDYDEVGKAIGLKSNVPLPPQ
ncbi:monooxygenase sphC [Aspergillus homomorphus CBS 101889]|uniref:PhyH-domain-containing protein n=1 Tax=Aspergillus homomorphus (strain CBS 101889) TaxID=1450537 RepID=A0A395HLR4_ASPHC|nr:PhyH-domain-containing protein [Aspergillus homomorphus CBS 101889]RAL08882.1 PhyH-domain-containing protein [Aspergillus homomorphus CBS 101889]